VVAGRPGLRGLAVPLDAFVLDDGVFGDLGEIGLDVGLRGEAEYRWMSVVVSVMGFSLRGGIVRWWAGCRRRAHTRRR
jgi:hypothetical protein